MPNTPLKGDYNTYIGARYVPIIGGMWNQQTEYEPLTIVMYQGSSFTSKTFVPKGTQIDNTTYWVRTANYDEQVEFYRQEVIKFHSDVQLSEQEFIKKITEAQNTYEDNLTDRQNKYETGLRSQVLTMAQTANAPVFTSSTANMTDTSKMYVLTSNSHIYYYNGTNFVDSGTSFGQPIEGLTPFNGVVPDGTDITTLSDPRTAGLKQGWYTLRPNYDYGDVPAAVHNSTWLYINYTNTDNAVVLVYDNHDGTVYKLIGNKYVPICSPYLKTLPKETDLTNATSVEALENGWYHVTNDNITSGLAYRVRGSNIFIGCNADKSLRPIYAFTKTGILKAEYSADTDTYSWYDLYGFNGVVPDGTDITTLSDPRTAGLKQGWYTLRSNYNYGDVPAAVHNSTWLYINYTDTNNAVVLVYDNNDGTVYKLIGNKYVPICSPYLKTVQKETDLTNATSVEALENGWYHVTDDNVTSDPTYNVRGSNIFIGCNADKSLRPIYAFTKTGILKAEYSADTDKYSWYDLYGFNGVLPDGTDITTLSDPRTAGLKQGWYTLRPNYDYGDVPAAVHTWTWLYINYTDTNNAVVLVFDNNDGTVYKLIGNKYVPISHKNSLYGKHICVIGDSVTEKNFRAEHNWVDYMSDLGIDMINLGISGTGFANPSTDKGNYTTRISKIPSYAQMVGVSASVNDVNYKPIGTADDTTTDTVLGCVRNFFDEYFKSHSAVPIICYTMNRGGGGKLGDNLKAYLTGIEEICLEFNVPFLNLVGKTGLNSSYKEQRVKYFTSENGVEDTYHPNSEGHKFLFRKLLPFFEECFPSNNDIF